ncbi:thiosulfate oxidation carrier protein SoxY [Sulfurimonas sp.]|jgi:sulfur-oxidizing protein SoxY|uniref:thiosulfate oxidation carrier protein SoxY n=1 Tax=Sulfurimonas sp. TaxID=2022749 RepID=UPI0025EB9652|nr:thiosulfate oxidation carrier protein SoxY [Sulfurimonas sp.]MBT5935794.1 thiosulfate oxidation carrier protein SoxY [Sulfurimonas sp.]
MQRRDFFKKLGLVAAASALTPAISFASETKVVSKNTMSYQTAVDAITGGKTVTVSSKIKLKVPEIAENGAVVPVTVNIDSPMTENNYVKAIHILASHNFNARSIDVYLTPANGKAMFSTRIKLGGTQDVTALVELSNGDFISASQNVKVTIGGCG